MQVRLSVPSAVLLLGTALRLGSADYPHVRAFEYVEVYPVETCRVLVTAYNSEVAQTDDTPHVTSSQTVTRWGVAAARWLPIGVRVRVRDRFGDQEFVVEDRMPPKNWCKLDLWHEGEVDADTFGKQIVDVEVEGPPDGFTCPALPQSVDYKCPEPVSEWHRKAAAPRCPSYVEGCPKESKPIMIASAK